MNINLYLLKQKNIIDSALNDYLPSENVYPKVIHKTMRYSIFAGGKRIRSILILSLAKMANYEISKVLPLACAIELIHTYSLIHDDLPCIDNDDYRRGKLSAHRAFGENIALLAGDALLTLSFQILTKIEDKSKIPTIIEKIASVIGTKGMIGGQVVDVQKNRKSKKILEYIHTHKTGALFEVSMETGAILVNFSTQEISALKKYGANIGLAFQIIDDVFDKKTDKFKLTYPLIYGVDYSKKKAKFMINEAKNAIKMFKKNEILLKLANYIIERK